MWQEILNNYPLVAALTAVVTAQILKIPIHALVDRKIDISRAFSTGGMPSSHSAFVMALITALIYLYGWSHPLVAVSIVFGFIVMYDAAGVRRESGRQATVINMLREDMRMISERVQGMLTDHEKRQQNLKELLGHEPIEIIVGGTWGIVISFIVFSFYQ